MPPRLSAHSRTLRLLGVTDRASLDEIVPLRIISIGSSALLHDGRRREGLIAPAALMDEEVSILAARLSALPANSLLELAPRLATDTRRQLLEVLHLLDLDKAVVADVELHQRRNARERRERAQLILLERELRRRERVG